MGVGVTMGMGSAMGMGVAMGMGMGVTMGMGGMFSLSHPSPPIPILLVWVISLFTPFKSRWFLVGVSVGMGVGVVVGVSMPTYQREGEKYEDH